MATVKFSQDLRERIINTAKSKFQVAVSKAKEDYPKDWGDRIYDTIFAEHQAAVSALPAYWLDTTNNLTIHSVGGVSVCLTYPLKKERPYPAKMPQDKTHGLLAHKRSSYSDDLVLLDNPAFADFKQEVIAWKARVAAAEQRQKEFADSVKTVIHAYVTLAPALKAWPPLWDLIPDDVKEKHKQIVERKAKEVELDVDLDRMTALASFTKIRGVE